MYGFRRFGIKLGLSTIKKILSGLGNPQDAFACIHVAGTNGKGSVASSLASILYCSGYKTGLYTSPHLIRFNERIKINNRPISNEKVVASYNAVKSTYYGRRDPTFFEFTTAMALFEFAAQKVDWAVIETGMGGRLDATNIINPALSIITNISLEHREYLGNTIDPNCRGKSGDYKKTHAGDHRCSAKKSPGRNRKNFRGKRSATLSAGQGFQSPAYSPADFFLLRY